MDKILFVLLIFISANCNKNKVKDNKPIIARDSVNSTLKKPIVFINNNLSLKKWIQYKKVPVVNQLDTLPYKNCFITISKDAFSYYKKGKLIEKRTLLRDEKFKYEVYYFKEKPDDFLYFLDINRGKVVLKRDNYDGEQEYFSLVE